MITKEQIQVMVDGECSHEMRAALLRQMDSEPSTWRTLALSLLEEQEWARQVSVLPNRNTSSYRSIGPASDCELARCDSQIDSGSALTLVKRTEKPSDNATSFNAPWLSVLAASVLLGLGFYGGSYSPRFGGLDSNATNQETVAVSENPVSSNGLRFTQDSSNTNMRMLVSGPNSERAEIPIYDLNAMDHDVFVAKQAYEVARLNQRLRKEGFELDVKPEYYTGKLHDGRKLIVPVKQVGLKPYGL